MYGIIKFGRVCPGSHMKDKPDVGFIDIQPLKKIIAFHAVYIFFSLQIIYLIHAAEFVHQDKLLISFFVQKANQAATDETGGSRDDDA